jgi:anti-sigma factor RsiW
MIYLLRYWKAAAGLVLLAAMWGWGYYTKAIACDVARLTMENAILEAQRAEIAYWQEQAHKADEALRKALERPQAAPRIREVVRENPSDCSLPDPVADSLRDQIAAANKAGSAR